VGGAESAIAEPYEACAGTGDGSPLGIERSSDDLLFLYTGGTTGMPKGVMWTHRDQWLAHALCGEDHSVSCNR
jgi:long-subunit acyl-CoA synthetase (AMP-forming)